MLLSRYIFSYEKSPKKRTFRRARFSLLNKHPAGCPFTANFGEDFTPYTLGSRASGACRFAALAAWLRHERNHGCGATFSFAVNRFCLDGGGAYAPDEIGAKSSSIRGFVVDGFFTGLYAVVSRRGGKATRRLQYWLANSGYIRRVWLYFTAAISSAVSPPGGFIFAGQFFACAFSPLPSCLGHAVSAANRQAPQARRGYGERIPHQDSRRQNCRGNFWLPGRILL